MFNRVEIQNEEKAHIVGSMASLPTICQEKKYLHEAMPGLTLMSDSDTAVTNAPYR